MIGPEVAAVAGAEISPAAATIVETTASPTSLAANTLETSIQANGPAETIKSIDALPSSSAGSGGSKAPESIGAVYNFGVELPKPVAPNLVTVTAPPEAKPTAPGTQVEQPPTLRQQAKVGNEKSVGSWREKDQGKTPDGVEVKPLADKPAQEKVTQASATEAQVTQSGPGQKREAYQANLDKNKVDPDQKEEVDPKLLWAELGAVKEYQAGESALSPESQVIYDKGVADIEGKIANGSNLSSQEKQFYERHLTKLEQDEQITEASDIGGKITSEIEKTGEVSEETKTAMTKYLDKVTNGQYSENERLMAVLNTDGVDKEAQKRVNKRIAEVMKKITPEKSKEIEIRLQTLIQLEFQLLNAEQQKNEITHQVWDIKDFLEENKASFDKVNADNLNSPESFDNRQKWNILMQKLNSTKARLVQVNGLGLAVAQQYDETKNYIEYNLLGSKNVIKYALSGLGNKVKHETRMAAFRYTSDIKGVEGNQRPTTIRREPKLDLSNFKPK